MSILIESFKRISKNITRNESLAYMIIFDEIEKDIAKTRLDNKK